MFLIITNIGCALVLFPILKWQNEAISLGYVAARIMECTFILVGILAVLAVVTLRQNATAADAGSLVPIGKSLIDVKNWTFLLGPGFADGIGTGLLLGWLMYRSGLVHRRMALFGVIGGPLLAASGIAVLVGVIPQGSPVQSVMTIPEIIWEAVPGLVAHFQGFQCGGPCARASAPGAGHPRRSGQVGRSCRLTRRQPSDPSSDQEPEATRSPTERRSRLSTCDTWEVDLARRTPDQTKTAGHPAGLFVLKVWRRRPDSNR